MLSQVKPLFVSLLLLVGGCSSALAANSFVYCSRPAILSAVQKDHLLVLSSTIKDLLESSGSDVAIVSRSGIDLDRFNIRYSHTGISLKHSQNTPCARYGRLLNHNGTVRLCSVGFGQWLMCSLAQLCLFVVWRWFCWF